MAKHPDNVWLRIRELLDETPVTFGVHDAQRARRCAEKVLSLGDEELERLVLAEGFKKIISSEHSKRRAQARRRAETAVKAQEAGARQLMITQLRYPIVAPGNEPVILAEATYERINWMYESELRQLRGREQNVALLGHFRKVTAPFPGVPVGELVRTGYLKIEDLFPEDQSQAA